MSNLIACPFCRQMFEAGEATSCPDCGLKLESLTRLPPSYDAQIECPDEPIPPHMETLPWSYMGRGRGFLLVIAILGLVAFFMPWIRETAPELRKLSGYGLAMLRGYFWAPAVAWFVMIPLVLTRRSIYKMRGARIALAFLAAIVLMTVVVRLGFTPESSRLRPIRIEWLYGLYATAALSLLALGGVFTFGGRLEDIPTQQRRRGDETLH